MSRDLKKIALIVRKGKSLEEQLNSTLSGLDQAEINDVNAKLRLERLTVLFHAYEEHHDELVILNPDHEQIRELENLRNKYYRVASQVQMMQPSRSENNYTAPLGNSTFIEKQRLLKLPTAEIPKFDGNHDKWLAFKNTFKSMVDSRTDLDNVIKFTYLKNALQGEALNKLSIYDPSAENYENAWKLLIDSYDRKRVLVSKHLDAILNISTIPNATSATLSKLIDDVRQHLSMLKSLQVQPDDRVVVRILERALPVSIHRKWEESLSLDKLPELNKFYKFIRETIFRLQTFEQDESRRGGNVNVKRSGNQTSNINKYRRNEIGVRALISGTSDTCVQCKETHPLYKCPVFGKMTIEQRWNAIKMTKLCRNCLRIHQGRCGATHCKRCNYYHHTLLHRDTSSNAIQSFQRKDQDKSKTEA